MSRAPKSRTISGELALIETIRRKAAARSNFGALTRRPGPPSSKLDGVVFGIGDDCALLRPKPNYEICVTTDFSLENVHFRRAWHPPQSVGYRCLARGLSDLAAMGAEPLAIFLSLALPARTSKVWLDGFLEGFLALAARHNVPLAGGDTAQSPHAIAADIVAIGQLPRGSARLRSGAQPGDAIYVTGALGGSAAEFLALERSPGAFHQLTAAASNHPHLFPEPRLAQGRRLRPLAHASIDISDGLSTDLTHLCEASHLAAEMDAAALPVHPLAHAAEQSGRVASALELALHGGEDYELLFTASAAARIPRTLAGVPIHRIGIMRRPAQRQPQIVLNTRAGRKLPVEPKGWEHFK